MSLDARTRKNLHFEARAQGLKKAGIEVRTEELQRQIADDLRLVDRARAEGAISQPGVKRRKPARKAVARPGLHADALAEKLGGEFRARSVSVNDNEKAGEKLTGVEAERTLAMQRRLQHLSTRGPGRIKANQTVEKGPYLYPKFVSEVCSVAFSFDSKLGVFRGKSNEDCRRILRRKLEDICNRSDAAVGVSWWVR